METNLNAVMQTLQQLCTAYGEASTDIGGETLTEVYNGYLKSIAGKGSPRAYAGKVRLSRKILDEIGNTTINLLTFDMMSRYINSWTTKVYIRNECEQLYSQSHIDKVYNNLNCVFRYGVTTGLLNKNIMETIPCPISRRFTEDEEKALEEWEIQKVLNPCPKQHNCVDIETAFWYTVKVLLLYTGVRPGEAFAFCFSDFDYEEHTVKVRRALSLDVKVDVDNLELQASQPYIKMLKNEVNGKKDYARRKLVVGSFVINTVLWYKGLVEADPELLRLRRYHKTSNYLFAWYTDGRLKRPDYCCNAWRQHLIAHAVDPSQYNMYRFRHTFCTRLFKMHKLDPKTVQRLMGDNSMDMVMRVYHSISKDDLLSASLDYSKGVDTFLGVM